MYGRRSFIRGVRLTTRVNGSLRSGVDSPPAGRLGECDTVASSDAAIRSGLTSLTGANCSRWQVSLSFSLAETQPLIIVIAHTVRAIRALLTRIGKECVIARNDGNKAVRRCWFDRGTSPTQSDPSVELARLPRSLTI